MSLRSEFQGLEPNHVHTAVISWLQGQEPSARVWLTGELLALSSWVDEAYGLAESEDAKDVDAQFFVTLARIAEQEIRARGPLELQALRSVGFAARMGAHIELALHPDAEMEAGVPKLEAKRRKLMRDDWALFAAELAQQLQYWRHAHVDDSL